MSDKLSERIGFRVTPQIKKQFNEKCAVLGREPQDLLRELVNAVIEGKVTISVPPTKLNITKGLHHVD